MDHPVGAASQIVEEIFVDALQHQQARRLAEAERLLQQILTIDAGHADSLHLLGIISYQAGRYETAAEMIGKAIAISPKVALYHSGLGNALLAQDKFDDALASYERALALNPDYAEAHNNLGYAFHAQGKLREAVAQYERALTFKPDYAEAHYNRANIKSFRPGDAELEELERVAAEVDRLPASKAPYIHFALGKALEDVGEYDRAFEHLLRGNALKRQEIGYSETKIQGYFKRIIEVFDTELFERLRGTGDPSQIPVFLVGMPRSGSTLIEQILASHPQVHGGGELTALPSVTKVLLGFERRPIPYPEYVPMLGTTSARRLGQAYLAQLPTPDASKVRITDKLPGNFTEIGLLHLILPNARIIHIVRSPADTCVSCFATLFSNGNNFSYNLAELARYYRYYSKLMDYWRSVLPPGAMLDVSYEDVVNDLEEQARRLVAYCGLPWEDRCLRFHVVRRPVPTSSAVQVQQPLFRSSLNRWRRFEAYLQPLFSEIGELPFSDRISER